MIAFITEADPCSVAVRAVIQCLLEHEVSFPGWKEQSLPAEIPSDLEAYPAALIDENILRKADPALRRRLEDYSRNRCLMILPNSWQAKPPLDQEESIHVRLNCFLASFRPEKDEIPPVDEQTLIRDVCRTAVDFFDGSWRLKIMNEYCLHYLEAWLALESSSRRPENWDCRLEKGFELMIALLSDRGGMDQLAGFSLVPEYAERYGKPEILAKATALLDNILERRPRTDGGILSCDGNRFDPLYYSGADTPEFGNSDFTICRRHLVMNELLHFLGGACAAFTRATGDEKYIREAFRLLRYIDRVHRDPADGLLFHASCRGERVGRKWSRGNTHALMGVFYMLKHGPDFSAPEREELVNFLDRTGDSLIRRQAASGRWHTVMDDPSTLEDSSCTVLILWMYSWCVNRGLLDSGKYREMLLRSRNILLRRFWRGYGTNNCRGSLPALDAGYYQSRGTHCFVMPLIVPALLESSRLA